MSAPRASQLERNRRILLVDDNPDIHKDFQKILRPRYDLRSASHGRDGVALVRAGVEADRRVAVAFVDARMQPGRSGVDTVKQMWKEDPHVEVVLCTAFSDLSWDELSVELGHTDQLLILKKPFDAMEVEQLAHALTEKWTLRRQAETSLRQVEAELVQASKLEAVGRLAAGLAHEINTPLQIAFHSAGFVADAFEAVSRLLAIYERARETLSLPTALLVELGKAEAASDLAYLREQAPEAAKDLRLGLERVAALVRALKRFSSVDKPERAETDLNAALTDTLAVSRAEYTAIASVETVLGPLPSIRCHAGELNLVFLGLIRNAVQAMSDARRPGLPRGRLRVATRVEAGHAVIDIGDTGVGIPEGIRDRIFEPFFTTREVGRGIGLGLATARAVVTKHGGTIDFVSVPGEGTTFTVRLPIVDESRRRRALSSR